LYCGFFICRALVGPLATPEGQLGERCGPEHI
jgi:hypothetical protein